MIKKCKIVKTMNGAIWGVLEKPIKEGDVVDLNSGQLLTCLYRSVLDEILPSGATVRLDLDNYLLDNSKGTKEATIKDEVVVPEQKKEEVKKEEPVEETVEEIVGQDKIEETVKTEEKVSKNNNNKKNNKK